MGGLSVSVSVLAMTICILCFNVICAVACWRQVSVSTSERNRLRQAVESVENFESRIDELRQRINSISRKYALEERRDPESGKSRQRDDDGPGDHKTKLRRQYGLSGLNHADIARRASRAGE